MSLSIVENDQLDAITLRLERKAKFRLYRELETESRKEWLVQNLLGAGDASAFYGVPGCGKSVLVEDLALHVAAGQEWHGRQIKSGAVLYVALERKKLVERRAIAFRERHQIADIPFAIIGGMYDLRAPQPVADIVEVVRQIEKETAQNGCGAMAHCSARWTPRFTSKSYPMTCAAPPWRVDVDAETLASEQPLPAFVGLRINRRRADHFFNRVHHAALLLFKAVW